MNKIITIIFLAIFIFTPIFVLASIDQNLYYGLKLSNGVKELQQFLIGKGFLTGNVTGNFYSLTLNAVKNYQASKKINNTGYVGPLTRQAINADLSLSATNNSVVISTTTSNTPLTGLLKLSKSTSYGEQKVTAPQTKFKLSDFSLTNNTTELINLKTIEIDLAMGVNLYTTNTYLTNLYVVYGSNTTLTLGIVSHINNFAIDYKLPIGQTINLSVYGDVNSSIPLSSTINSSILVSGMSENSKTIASTNSNSVLAGQNIIFGTSSFTVSQDNTASTAKTFVTNQKIVAGKFKFTTVADSYNISELRFIIPGSSDMSVISDVTLLDTITQAVLAGPVKPVYNSKDMTVYFQTNINVPINSFRSITVSYNLSKTLDSRSANINIAPILIYVKAANSSGSFIDGVSANYINTYPAYYRGITLPDIGLKVSGIYIFKTVPILTAVSSSTSVQNNSDVNLYTFNISADPAGDVSIKQIVFDIKISNPNSNTYYPNLNNLKLFKGNIDHTSAVNIGRLVNNNYMGLMGENGIGMGANKVVLTFNIEETIPAGKTQTYTLKAYAGGFTNGANTTTTVSADTVTSTSGSYLRAPFSKIYGLAMSPTDITSITYYNLLWSDKSATSFLPHSDTNGFSTNDWYNGFGVLNLPLTSQTIVAAK